MTTKHTPGPWSVDQDGVYAANGEQLGVVFSVKSSPNWWSEGVANTNLIASAPELLEALEALVNSVEFRIDDPRSKLRDAAKLAITKAKGE